MIFGYNIPIFFEDCSNPITLKYVNNIAKNYKVDSNELLEYDGTLLRNIKNNVDELKNTISFKLNIITQNDEEHTINLNIDIPLEDENDSVLNGSFKKNDENLNLKF
jgi:hypothetical protein